LEQPPTGVGDVLTYHKKRRCKVRVRQFALTFISILSYLNAVEDGTAGFSFCSTNAGTGRRWVPRSGHMSRSGRSTGPPRPRTALLSTGRRPVDVAQAVDRVIGAASDIQVVGAVPVVRRSQDICPPAVMEPRDAELDFADGVLRAIDEKLVINKQRNTSLRWICPRAVFASPPILAHAENRCTKFRRNSEKFFWA